MSAYLLGHDPVEAARLDAQASLLRDPGLDDLIQSSKNVLEIGCGTGSNYDRLFLNHPYVSYTGIDLFPEAIGQAKTRFPATDFRAMNATTLDFPGASFDLVFSKLTLWAVGSQWTRAVDEALRVLKPGGVFSAFEPCDRLVSFSPPKPAFSEEIRRWDERAEANGMNPHLGPQVASGLARAGFTEIKTRFFPALALTHETAKYQAIMENLKRFYFADRELPTGVRKEIETTSPGGLVMDTFFVTVGKKATS